MTRRQLRGLALLAPLVLVLLITPAPAWAALDSYSLKAYGGTWLADCADPRGPRVILEADAIVVIDGAKRVSSPHIEGAAAWYGEAHPPEYRTAILSRVGEDPGLVFALYEDVEGYFGRLDNDFTALEGIRPEVLAMTFRLCRTAPAAPAPTPASEVKPAPAPAPGAKAMGTRMRERWIAVLDGPAPPNRTVKLGDQEYVQVAACKAHDCSANNMLVLWSAPKKQLYGLVRQAGVNALLGRAACGNHAGSDEAVAGDLAPRDECRAMTDLTTALLLIDVQVNMFAPESPVAGADTLISRLGGMLAGARAAGVPVVLDKTTCDTFARTPLAPALRARGVNREPGDRVIAVRAEAWSF